jgi:hypothetical protein
VRCRSLAASPPSCKGVRNAVAHRLLCHRDGVDVDQPLGVATTGVGVTGSALPSVRGRPINGSVSTHSADSQERVASIACRQVNTGHGDL